MRSVIEQVSDGVQRLLVMNRQILALGKHLAQQPIGALAGASLPGAVWVTKVHADVHVADQLTMPAHLFASVICLRLAQRRSNRVELDSEGSQLRLGSGVWHLGQQHQGRGTLGQCSHAKLVACSFDQIAFPAAMYHVAADLGLAHAGSDHLGELTTPICCARAWPSRALVLARASDRSALCATRLWGVCRSRCGLSCARRACHDFRAACCAVSARSAGATTTSPASATPKATTGSHVELGACATAPLLTGLLRAPRGVLAALRIARQLSDQRAWAATNFLRHLSERFALLHQRCQRYALFSLHLSESSRHLHTLPGWQNVAFQT